MFKEEMKMKSFSYTVKDELGIHARPAGMLVKEVKNFQSKVTLEKDGKSVDASRLMAVMGMGVKKDQTVTVTVHGDQFAQRIARIHRGEFGVEFFHRDGLALVGHGLLFCEFD